MSLTYFSICITEYSLSWTCYSLSITCHSLCERGPGPWVTRFVAIWGSLMDPLLIIHGSIYWIGPLDMWINHSGKTAYTTDYEGFRAYLLTVLQIHCASSPVRGLRPVTGLRRAPFFLKSVFTGNFWRNLPYFLSVQSYPKYTSYVCFNARGCVYKLQAKSGYHRW